MSSIPLRLRRSSTAHKRPNAVDIVEGEVTINYNSSSCGFFIRDNLGSIKKIGPVEISSSAPNSSPTGSSGNSEGELWYEPSSQELKIYYSGAWETVASPHPTGYTGTVTEGSTTFTIVNGIITNVT